MLTTWSRARGYRRCRTGTNRSLTTSGPWSGSLLPTMRASRRSKWTSSCCGTAWLPILPRRMPSSPGVRRGRRTVTRVMAVLLVPQVRGSLSSRRDPGQVTVEARQMAWCWSSMVLQFKEQRERPRAQLEEQDDLFRLNLASCNGLECSSRSKGSSTEKYRPQLQLAQQFWSLESSSCKKNGGETGPSTLSLPERVWRSWSLK